MKYHTKAIMLAFSSIMLLANIAKAQVTTEMKVFGYQRLGYYPANLGYNQTRELENLYLNTQGSRYLLANWVPAKITNQAGDNFTNVVVKYDIWNDQVEAIANNRQVVVNDINKLVLYNDSTKNLNFRNGFPSIDDYNKHTLYQVLADGKRATLLKKPVKKLQVESVYNTGLKANQFNDAASYYIFKNQQMLKLSLNNKSLAEALADKKNPVLAYINIHKLKLNNDTDLQKVLDYYNTL